MTAIAAIVSAVLAAAPTHKVATKPVRTVEGELTLKADIVGVRVTQWTVFSSELPALPYQTEVSSRLEPGGAAGREVSTRKRGILVAKVLASENPAAAKGFSATYTVKATLHSRTLVPLAKGEAAPKVEPIGATERQASLANGKYTNFRAIGFQKWLDAGGLRRAKDEDPLAFAQRAYKALSTSLLTFRYSKFPATAVPRQGRSS